MKKIISIFCVTALLVSLTGCSNGEIPDALKESDNTSTISDNLSSNNNSDESNNLENPNSMNSSPEPQKPKGEPTLLTKPDGTPIYTSEISEIYKGSEERGNKETISLEQAEQLAHEGGDFTVKCDGFFYGYIPEKALNRVDDPEMFEERGDGETFEFLGEMSDRKSGYNRRLIDLTCFKVGDKFNGLTVKRAYTLFTNDGESKGFSGVHVSDGYIEFDGEIELEGYINVTPMETFYGTGGDMEFLPNGESSTKLPDLSPAWDQESNKYYAVTDVVYCGYFGDWKLDFGNMYKVDCDTSGLQPGDSFVKVKGMLDNIKYVPGNFGGLKVELKSIELI